MTRRQELRLKMFQSVMQVLKDHAEIFKGVDAFESHQATFENLLGMLNDTAIEQEQLSRTRIESARREQLANDAQELCAALFSIGRERGDHSLMGTANCSFSDLRYSKASEAARIYNFLYTVAERETEALAMLGWNDTKLKAFGEEALAFLDHTGEYRSNQIKRKANTRLLAKFFDEIQDLLESHMDAVGIQIRKTEPEIYYLYKESRKVQANGAKNNFEEGDSSPPDQL